MGQPTSAEIRNSCIIHGSTDVGRSRDDLHDISTCLSFGAKRFEYLWALEYMGGRNLRCNIREHCDGSLQSPGHNRVRLDI